MKRLAYVLAVIAVALPSLFATGAASAASSALPPRDPTTILVKWVKTPPPGVQSTGELKTKVKIVKVPRLWTVDQTVKFYESLPNVAYAEPNYIGAQHGVAAPNDYFYPQQWALARIQALAGWGVYPGDWSAAGAPIAIVDTGVDASHEDLSGQVAPGANCLTGVCIAGGLSIDDNGHGTVNAGAAAAAGNNGKGMVGVAHGAQIIPVKALNSSGSGTYAAISAGIIWAADNGAKVINLSLGGLASSRTLCDAVQYALDKGAFVDAASGNLSTSDPVYPASCPGVVGVGATDPTDAVPAWSDTGQGNVFVSAPGVLVHGTYPGNRYALGTGTSVAAGLVSGLASLLIGQDPNRSPADVRRILALSSDKVGTTPYGADPYHTCTGCTWNASAGYGRIDVYKALTTDPGASSATPPPAAGGDSGGTSGGSSGGGSGGSSSNPAPPSPPAAARDFSISVPPGAVTARQGDDAKWTVTATPQNGFNDGLDLSVTGLPAGATAAFAPASVPASGSSALTVSVGAGTPAGSYTLTIRAVGGGLTRTTTANLVVTAAPLPASPAQDFTLSATPGSAIVRLGGFKSITITARGAQGLVNGVQLGVQGLPAGVTATFTQSSAGVWTLRLDCAAAPAAQKFTFANLTITGKLGSVTRTASLAVTLM